MNICLQNNIFTLIYDAYPKAKLHLLFIFKPTFFSKDAVEIKILKK
jgi:hypothetical protein